MKDLFGFYIPKCLTLATIIVCSVFLLLYGLTFGLIKCYLWITAVAVSIFVGLAFIQPANIFIFSYISTLIMKTAPYLQFKKIPENILQNPYDEKKAFTAYKKRLENYIYYTPVPKYRLMARAENIKYHLEQRLLFVDILFFLIFSIALIYLVVINRSYSSYYSTRAVENLLVYGYYTQSIPFTEVSSYREYIQYVNYTFFPALFGPTYTDYVYGKPNRLFRRNVEDHEEMDPRWFKGEKRYEKMATKQNSAYFLEYQTPVWDEESINEIWEKFKRTNRNESQKNLTNIYERGWTLDRSIKLIGIPRMRQLRVRNHTCKFSKYIKPRENMCFAEFSLVSQEKGNFGLWWRTADESLTVKEQKPWIYASGWDTSTVYCFGKHSAYPPGGYILDYAKHINDSRTILNFMDAFQWIDARTRVVILEFTLYSANVNLFSVVHLIAERSATGSFIPSYQINTARFMYLAEEFEAVTVAMFILFCVLLTLFILRQLIRIDRTSIKSYLTEGNPTVDILIIILGVLSIIFMILRTVYVKALLNKLDTTQNYEYISFAYAVIWDQISTYFHCFLVILVAVKLIHLLTFRVIFRQLHDTLRYSLPYIIAVLILMIFVFIAFAFFFHLVLGTYAYEFSTFLLSFTSSICYAFFQCSDNDYAVFAYTPWFVAPLFYLMLLIIIGILLMGFFVGLIFFFFIRIKSTRIQNKYNAVAYLKHILVANRRTDILRLKGGSFEVANHEDGGTLRLRGGGAAWKKSFKDHPADKYSMPPEYLRSKEAIRRWEPVFAKRTVYEFIKPYLSREDPYRFEAIRYLSKAHLETDHSAKLADREMAMKFLLGSRLDPKEQTTLQVYYLVTVGNKKVLVSTNILNNMRTVVNDYGREKMFEKYENAGLDLIFISEEIEDLSENVEKLDKKVGELNAMVDEKYKGEKKYKKKPKSSLPSESLPKRGKKHRK